MESPEAQAVAVIGAGAWGTTLAQLLADKGVPVHLWVREPEVFAALGRERVNHTFLPGVRLSGRIMFTQEFAVALQGVRLVLMATPSHVFREVLRELRPHLPPDAVLVSATKGMEIESLLTMEGVVREELGAEFPYAVLSGPSFAREVAQKSPIDRKSTRLNSRHGNFSYAVFSGPSFAREVAQKQPTAVTIASREREIDPFLQRIFSVP